MNQEILKLSDVRTHLRKVFKITLSIFQRLGQKSYPLNCFWIVEQDAVVEWALLG